MSFAYKVPNWLKGIPKGEYTIMDFMKITKQAYSNINERLKILKVKFKKKKVGASNYLVKHYIWLGSEHYEKESLLVPPKIRKDKRNPWV